VLKGDVKLQLTN